MSRRPRSVCEDETAEYRNPYEHYKNSLVAESYDASRFAGLPGSIFDRLEKRRILDAFSDVPKEATILDAPCGTGRLAEALLEAGYRVFGMDISPAMLQVASRKLKRHGSRFQTELGDLRKLAEDNRRFDAALCARLLMHVPLHEQVCLLSNVARLSSRVVVFNQSLNTPYQRFRRLIKRTLWHQRPVAYPVTPQQLQQLVAESGLSIERQMRVAALVSEAVVIKCVRSGQ